MKKKFEITLAILEPTPNVKIDFTSTNLTNDIMNARDDFTIYHKEAQKLEIIGITKSMINVELEIEVRQEKEIELYRKINLFSRRLYNKYNWKQYSNLPSRLLTIVTSREIVPPVTSIETSSNNSQEIIEDNNIGVVDMRTEKLRYLYAKKRYVELEIEELEQQGITLE